MESPVLDNATYPTMLEQPPALDPPAPDPSQECQYPQRVRRPPDRLMRVQGLTSHT